jgi:hypothetical protein
MVDVYYYVPSTDTENAVECGLKISRWYEKEVKIAGENKKCISALLNPKDDIEKYKSSEYECLKLELAPHYCFVADSHLYRVGHRFETAMRMYAGSIIPIENYIFGSYRKPEVLVTTTPIAGQISILNKKLDLPVLFDNSEELYINNIMETFKEEHDDFNDVLLYYFYCKLSEEGSADKIEDEERKIALFLDRKKEKVITLKIPDISTY